MSKKSKKTEKRQGHEFGGGDLTDIVIPVMGPTGAGKSTFINAILSGESLGRQPLMKVGTTLCSCTQELQVSVIDSSSLSPQLRGRRVVIVDTPGFDDTFVGDAQILRRIAEWLKTSYNNKMILAGVIYLHDISQDRFSGTARRNLEMFTHLCGDAALSKVVIGTTKSNKISPETFIKYEKELKGKHWKEMIAKGTRVAQFRADGSANDYQSARNVVNLILRNVTRDTILEIQKELAIDKKITPETKAGKELRHTLQEYLDMQKELAAAEEAAAAGAADDGDRLKVITQRIEILSKEIRDLKIPLALRLRRLFGF